MYNQQLETFINVVEEGSFSKAANKAYIPPIKYKIRNLMT